MLPTKTEKSVGKKKKNYPINKLLICMSVLLYNTATTDACGGCLKAIQQDII